MDRIKKNIFMIMRISTSFLAWGIGAYALHKLEYFKEIANLDNVIGAIPVALVLVGAGTATALLWMKHTRLLMPVSVCLAVMMVLSIAVFPVAKHGSWWINMTISAAKETKPDLSVYQPFSEGSKNPGLGEKSTLALTADLPVLDGATALYPVYAAFAEAVYGRDIFAEEDVHCTNTRGAYEAVAKGERDIIFVAGASKAQMEEANAAGADLHFTPIGKEAFVFLVGKENPVDTISYQQMRNIYSGKTANWATLRWKEGGRIIAFQRPEGSGSQSGLQKIMGELPIQSPQPLPSSDLIGTNSLMKQVAITWKGVQPAIGYSYRYYATVMYANPEVKILKVNGVAPSIENIQNGSYPFVSDFYAVTNGAPEGNAELLIDWILSEQGQEIVQKVGYVPVR